MEGECKRLWQGKSFNSFHSPDFSVRDFPYWRSFSFLFFWWSERVHVCWLLTQIKSGSIHFHMSHRKAVDSWIHGTQSESDNTLWQSDSHWTRGRRDQSIGVTVVTVPDGDSSSALVYSVEIHPQRRQLVWRFRFSLSPLSLTLPLSSFVFFEFPKDSNDFWILRTDTIQFSISQSSKDEVPYQAPLYWWLHLIFFRSGPFPKLPYRSKQTHLPFISFERGWNKCFELFSFGEISNMRYSDQELEVSKWVELVHTDTVTW